jgi:hypothetical protein
LIGAAGNDNVIVIDLNAVGDQGEGLNVVKFWGFPLNNFEHSGVDIQVTVDGGDYEDGLYDLSFMEGTNKLIFSKPLMEGTYFDKREFDRIVTDVTIRKGHDSARTAYKKLTKSNGEMKMKKFDVIFPVGYQLSQRIFTHPTGVEGEYISAVGDFITYKKDTGHRTPATAVGAAGNQPIFSLRSRLSWKFTNLAEAREIDAGADQLRAQVGNAYAGM